MRYISHIYKCTYEKYIYSFYAHGFSFSSYLLLYYSNVYCSESLADPSSSLSSPSDEENLPQVTRKKALAKPFANVNTITWRPVHWSSSAPADDMIYDIYHISYIIYFFTYISCMYIYIYII